MLCIDRTDVDVSTAVNRDADGALAAEAAFALDLATALDRHTVNARRDDFDFEIVVARTVLVAGVDYELPLVLNVKSGELRASFHQGDVLDIAAAQDHAAAAAQFDRAESLDRYRARRKRRHAGCDSGCGN